MPVAAGGVFDGDLYASSDAYSPAVAFTGAAAAQSATTVGTLIHSHVFAGAAVAGASSATGVSTRNAAFSGAAVSARATTAGFIEGGLTGVAAGGDYGGDLYASSDHYSIQAGLHGSAEASAATVTGTLNRTAVFAGAAVAGAASASGAIAPAPYIVSVSDSTPQVGDSLVIRVAASQPATAVTVTFGARSWNYPIQSSTPAGAGQYDLDVDVARGNYLPYGLPLGLFVTTGAGATAPVALQISPLTGWAYVTIDAPLVSAQYRITAVADLTDNDQLEYETLGGVVTVYPDGHFELTPGVTLPVEFDVAGWDVSDASWSPYAAQRVALPVVFTGTAPAARAAASGTMTRIVRFSGAAVSGRATTAGAIQRGVTMAGAGVAAQATAAGTVRRGAVFSGAAAAGNAQASALVGSGTILEGGAVSGRATTAGAARRVVTFSGAAVSARATVAGSGLRRTANFAGNARSLVAIARGTMTSTSFGNHVFSGAAVSGRAATAGGMESAAGKLFFGGAAAGRAAVAGTVQHIPVFTGLAVSGAASIAGGVLQRTVKFTGSARSGRATTAGAIITPNKFVGAAVAPRATVSGIMLVNTSPAAPLTGSVRLRPAFSGSVRMSPARRVA